MERDGPVWPVEKPTKRSTSRNTLKATTLKEVIISATYVGNIAGQETPFKSTCQQNTDNHNDIHNNVYPDFNFSAAAAPVQNAPNNGYKKIAMRLRGRCVQEVGMMRSSSQDDQFHFLAGSCCYF